MTKILGHARTHDTPRHEMPSTPLAAAVVTLLPIVSIFALGRAFPPSRAPSGRQEYRPVFQPPSWVFGVVWTIVSLALGGVTAVALERLPGRAPCVLAFYASLLAGLLAWLPLNHYEHYRATFYLLVALAFLSVLYVVYLSCYRVPEGLALLPLAFWLIFASCLNGVIYDHHFNNHRRGH